MLKKQLLFLIFLLTASMIQASTAKGTFVLDGKTYNITSVQARTDANPFDKSKKDVLILLTDQPVVGDSFEVDELDSLAESGKIHGILARIDDQKQPIALNVLGVVQRSGNAVYEFEAEMFDPDHVSGRIYLNDPDESFGRKYTFDIEFDSPVQEILNATLAETGTPLPVDGGEPFKAYREYDRAIQSGNPQMLKKFLAPEQAERLDDPDAGKMLGLMKMMRAQEVKFVKGFQQGDRAILTVEGKDPLSSGKTNGTIKMLKAEGQWLLEKESWTSSLN